MGQGWLGSNEPCSVLIAVSATAAAGNSSGNCLSYCQPILQDPASGGLHSKDRQIQPFAMEASAGDFSPLLCPQLQNIV